VLSDQPGNLCCKVGCARRRRHVNPDREHDPARSEHHGNDRFFRVKSHQVRHHPKKVAGSRQSNSCLPWSHAFYIAVRHPGRVRRSQICGQRYGTTRAVESGDSFWVDRTVYRPPRRILPSLSRGRLRYRGRTCTVLMRRTPAKARRTPESSRQEWAPIRAGRSSCPPDRRHRNLLRRQHRPGFGGPSPRHTGAGQAFSV
jgi:hypothetical protein